jgi:preprotein translocase subunit SecB
MFTNKYSGYKSIRNPATPEEQETVRESVNYLIDLLVNLNEFNRHDEDFEREFKSEVAKVSSPQLFAESMLYVATANVISKAATESLFQLRNENQIELMGVLCAAILFSFIRYPEWIQEKFA